MSLKNRELFLRDPATAQLMNNGQARISDGHMTAQESATLREELANFVCEGQYAKGIQRVLESFLSHLGGTSQPAAWVSGFYGSGKSHLLKMLGHLWVNTEFSEDGATARSLVPPLPKEIEALLRELDIQGRRAGGLHAALGTLPSGSAESVRLTILGILLRSRGLPDRYAQARFCLYLKNNGFYDQVKAAVEAKGKNFLRELSDLYMSPVLRGALQAADPNLGSAADARELLKREFTQPDDISTDEFLRVIREFLAPGKQLPLTVLVLDEVQIYVRNSLDRTQQVVEVAEALGKQMNARVLVVGAGQNALSSEVQEFSWMRARFTLPVELSDTDVETVTRRVLLAKKPDRVTAVRAVLDTHAGEIARQLANTRIAPRISDQETMVDDYPLLPARHRFWEEVFRVGDPTGASGMLRTQLRIIHEALRALADKPVGAVIPADFIFEQLQAGMLQQGVLPHELDERIRKLNDGTPAGSLAARLCGLIFLIRKLPRTGSADCGVRATPDMLADLLISDLASDGPALRRDVPAALAKLQDNGTLLRDGEEYNLQTRESQEWDSEFRKRVSQYNSNESAVNQKRDAFLRAVLQHDVDGVRLRQGESKEPRKLALTFGDEPPAPNGQDIPVWVRDGWGCSEKQMLDAAKAAGTDSPVVFVYVPKAAADELRTRVIHAEAANGTLDYKGVPTTPEGKEARSAMETRFHDAERARDQLISDIAGAAKVFQGGGVELFNLSLTDKVREAADAAVVRLFPQFAAADSKHWPAVITRARNGDDSPLKVLGHQGPTEQHPVCKEILRQVGTGSEGRELRKHFANHPYGWPQDAIDGALIALHAGGHLLARYGSAPLAPGQLDQNKIPKTEFRVETITLSTSDKLKLRGLFQEAGIPAKPSDDLILKSADFLACLDTLAQNAGGPAPLPPAPDTKPLADLHARHGNDRLKAMLDLADPLKADIAAWKKAGDLAAKRLPSWRQLQGLLAAGTGVPELADVVTDAHGIQNNRLLLDKADHVAPLLKKAAQVLRSSLTAAHQAYKKQHAERMTALEANETWKKLKSAQRPPLLARFDLANDGGALNIGTDEALQQALEQTPVSGWQDKTAALSGRFEAVLREAAKLLEPEVQHIRLTSGTLKTPAEVKAWLEAQEKHLLQKLENGPVMIG